MLQQLATCGLHPDAEPVYQSQRAHLYQQALDQLIAQGNAYPCACSRQDIARALSHAGMAKPRHGELIYPGICRTGLHGKAPRAWRLNTSFYEQNKPLAQNIKEQVATDSIAFETLSSVVHWRDRRLGAQHQDVAAQVGDFILKRADGCFAYQLAVVVDDGAQGITDVVRGADLADNTARQILLQRALHLPTPRYLHTPLVLGASGEKLSKQNGAQALDLRDPLAALNQAASVLGLSMQQNLSDARARWVQQWQALNKLA